MSIVQPFASAAERALIRERDGAIAELDRGGRPGVTVCIPCFGQAEYLPDALSTVYAQTVAPLEVIVVDDGSTEPLTVGETIVPTRVVRVTNRGLPSARNTALMLARGDAFLPLDADDWLEPTYIEKTLPLFQAGADVVLTGIQEHGLRDGRYEPGFDRPWQEVTADLILGDYNRFFYCSLFRTQMLRETGGYNARMNEGLEDADLWVDLLRRRARFAAVDEPLFNYRTGHGMLQTIHANGGYHRMVAEMQRHHGYVPVSR